jgi:5-methylthioadenosine/S-adenosylhomocysteine deaminase
MKPKSADILVVNGTLLTLNANHTEIVDGAVAINRDTITAVGTVNDLADWSASRVIDARGGIIMPGLINTHTHAAISGNPARLRRNDHVRYHLLL